MLYYEAFKKAMEIYRAYKKAQKGKKQVDGVSGLFKGLIVQAETGREAINVGYQTEQAEISVLRDARDESCRQLEKADKMIKKLKDFLD